MLTRKLHNTSDRNYTNCSGILTNSTEDTTQYNDKKIENTNMFLVGCTDYLPHLESPYSLQ